MGKPTEKMVATLLKFKVDQSEIDAMSFESASEKIGALIKGAFGEKAKGSSSTYTKPTVKRCLPEGDADPEIQAIVDAVVINAYVAAKRELPEENESSQTFGYAYGAWKNVIASHLF